MVTSSLFYRSHEFTSNINGTSRLDWVSAKCKGDDGAVWSQDVTDQSESIITGLKQPADPLRAYDSNPLQVLLGVSSPCSESDSPNTSLHPIPIPATTCKFCLC
ncbi:hypothetical protein CHARACLAT_028403 [Characodon lateralis]|uniref:Uncharacterized protein n=1 Tax=Characodon lateralis TaxID=208331 RepID=A0ABU7DYG3_9TELE|nr:hypothetical protein [Characodon lateralis]